MDDKPRLVTVPVKAAKRPLGTTAKSSPPPSESNKRKQRFAALSQARNWLSNAPKTKRADVKFSGDVYRTHDCKWASLGEMVYVFRDPAHQAAHYGSLVTCGSVWACPVCASKIQQRRRVELEQLTSFVEQTGRASIMVTFTFPHTRIQTLRELLLRQRKAFEILRKGSPWDRFKKRLGYQGLVRSLEITHGANGWHPHTHELWVLNGPVYAPERPRILSDLIDRWERACIAAGLLDAFDEVKLRAFRARSVDIRWQVSCADYLAKQDASRAWGVEAEIALGRTKAGRAAGVHPHEFLVRKGEDGQPVAGDRERFIEYVDTTKELRTRQLYWSQGLKALCGLTDKTDEELADESSEFAELFLGLSRDQWRWVRGNEVRAHLLDLADVGDLDGCLRLLALIGAPLFADQAQQLAIADALG